MSKENIIFNRNHYVAGSKGTFTYNLHGMLILTVNRPGDEKAKYNRLMLTYNPITIYIHLIHYNCQTQFFTSKVN